MGTHQGAPAITIPRHYPTREVERAVHRCGLMRLGLVALVVFGCSSGPESPSGAPDEPPVERWCATDERSEGEKLATEVEVSRLPRREAVTGGTIRVHAHVITASEQDRGVSDAAIAGQIDVLGRAFAVGQWRFELAGIDRRVNRNWVPMRAGSPEEVAVKSTLRRGTPRDLDLYIVDPGNGVLGYATYPTDYRSAPKHDGVVVHPEVLPGTGGRYGHGDQVVHQVGHWLGLYHTYSPECSTDRGDFVADTTPSAMPAFGCPVGRDTCRSSIGADSIRNYMDSTDDLCMNQFTSGQLARMQTQFDAFRRFE